MRIAFDFDGTLVDSMPKLRELGTTVLQDYYDLDERAADERYMATVGRSFIEQLGFLFPNNPLNLKAAHAFYDVQAEVYEDVTLYPGVIETVEFLNEEGIGYGLVSSTASELARNFLKDALPEFQGLVTGRAEGTKFSQLKDQLGNKKAPDRWFIGDTTWDEYTAERAGVNFVPVTHTFPAEVFDQSVQPQDSIPEAVDEAIQARLRLTWNDAGPTPAATG